LLAGCRESLICATTYFVEITYVIHRLCREAEIVASPSGHPLPSREVIDDIIIGWSYVHGYARVLLEQQLAMQNDR